MNVEQIKYYRKVRDEYACIHEVYYSPIYTVIPRIDEWVNLEDHPSMQVTKIVHDIRDEIVEVYLYSPQ